MNKYIPYEAGGTHAISYFVGFYIKRKKGIGKKRRKFLLTKFKKYDSIMEPDSRRRGMLRIARAIGGQKAFEEFMRYRSKHKEVL